MSLSFAELLEDPVDPVGAYAGDPLTVGASVAERFPHQVSDFVVEAAMEGPQALLTWTAPLSSIDRIIIVRKQGEYPRHPSDGVLLADVSHPSLTAMVDLGSDLVEGDDLGAWAWWYYRVFTLPSNLDVADQFAGLGVQVLGEAPFTSEPLDMQPYRQITIQLDDGGDGATVTVETAPTDSGPWVPIAIAALDPGASQQVAFADSAYKWIRVQGDAAFTASFIVPRETSWQTSWHASAVCLVYRSGYHLDRLWTDGYLPDFWHISDSDTVRRDDVFALREMQNPDGSRANIAESLEPRGPLYRFLKLLTLELDRCRAHLDALDGSFSDIAKAPPAVLEHIASTMGWEFDPLRPLNDVRAELMRRPGELRMKGSHFLLESVVAQVLHLIPRVQRGGGLLFRLADPDLLNT